MSEAAGTLTCPQCGAPASPEARACAFCGTVLALVACPSCFGQIFAGAKHCPRCGAAASRAAVPATGGRPCPRCRQPLGAAAVGTVTLGECASCGGLWVDAASFERICQEREEQAAVLGLASPTSHAEAGPLPTQGYVPCPECARLMNRFNFAHLSGVIVDVCKGHGIWFDADELRRIVEFIRGGGLVRAREHERLELERERQRVQRPAREPTGPLFPDSAMTGPGLQPIDYGDVVSAARHLLKSLFG